MVWNIAWGILILAAVACKERKPDGILTERQMVNVMAELYLAEEKTNRLSVPYDSLKQLLPLFSARVFKKAGVSDTLFRKSFDYYMSDPSRLEDIYTALVDTLNLRSQRMRTQKKEVNEQAKKDGVPE